jgi:hypothetical protein
MLLCCLRRSLPPSATGASSFRSDASTSGSAVSPAACMILCVRFVWVVRRYVYPSQSRNTRYGWVVNPCPTGTCTLQDAPGFAWHANDLHHQRPTGLAASAPPRFFPSGECFGWAIIFFIFQGTQIEIHLN